MGNIKTTMNINYFQSQIEPNSHRNPPMESLDSTKDADGDFVTKPRLTPLSLHTELSASDLRRLLKIVSANDLS